LSCFCHGADPIDGHRKVVGQDQYPALGEVRETAKLLPRGQSPWWRDEGRHLLILCLFSIRGMRLAHMHNAKSREHAHTCRKARAIFKLRYKNKTNQLSGSLKLDSLPDTLTDFDAHYNKFQGSVDLTRLPAALEFLNLSENHLSGSVVLTQIPSNLEILNLSCNRFSANPTKGHLSVVGWTSTPVWGKPRTFLNPSSCFCHGADPIDGHRKVVGQDQYPALGEVRETAKLLPRGESPWWRDEGRHLLILCCFNPRDEISPHA
ncbi:hypothetical protein XU18_2096, partial [Perkinsela sp. CCAP 1560/4]